MSQVAAEAMFTTPDAGRAALDPGSVEVTGAAATEVATLWGDTVLNVKHFPHPGTYGAEKAISTRTESAIAGACMVAGGVVLGPALGSLVKRVYQPQVIERAQAFTLGEDPKSDVWMTPERLDGASRVSLIDADDRGSRINVLPGMTGEITLADGAHHDLLAYAGGRASFELPSGAKVRAQLGEFTFIISSVLPGKLPASSADTDWTAITYTGFSFLVHGIFLFLVYFVPPDPRSLALDTFDDSHRFARYLLVGPELQEPEEASWVDEATRENEQSGGQGQRHAGDEGQMGRQDSKVTSNHYGIKGPRDNPDPRMARERVKEYIGTSGILAAIQSNAPTSPFGADTALGNDPENALGALMGTQLGDNFGYGGLGLHGTGRGGGGNGEGTIGLGNFGKIGRGAGGGDGDGYGRCVGSRCSLRGRRPSGPSVSIRGGATVRGALSRDVIRRHIRRQLPAIRYCYERQLARRPDLAGRVAIRFVISTTGAVTSSSVAENTTGDAGVGSCVAQAVGRIGFPQPDGGVVIVTYPFVFQSAGN